MLFISRSPLVFTNTCMDGTYLSSEVFLEQFQPHVNELLVFVTSEAEHIESYLATVIIFSEAMYLWPPNFSNMCRASAAEVRILWRQPFTSPAAGSQNHRQVRIGGCFRKPSLIQHLHPPDGMYRPLSFLVKFSGSVPINNN